MALSLDAAIIPNWCQTLGAVEGLLDKAEDFARANDGETSLLQSRLIDDMLPLNYQFKSCWTHTAMAIEGVRHGRFSPEMTPPPGSIDELRKMILDARSACEAVGEDELEALADNEMVFSIGDKFRLDFTVQDFLLSFSTPNLYFHAATAYDILRMKGVEIGKRDYLGAMRVRSA